MTGAVGLLRALAAIGRGPKTATTAAPAGMDSASFAELLRRAGDGELTSGASVSVAPNADVDLSAAQLTKLATIADAAEAAGATKLLVDIDGQSVVLDVASRRVIGHPSPTRDGVVTGIDGAVRVRTDGAPGAAVAVPVGPAYASGQNPSVDRVLAAMQRS